MPCEKSYNKLWNNYLSKYGDFRQRLQTIRDDEECFMQFRLPQLKQQALQSSTSIKTSLVKEHKRKVRKCDSRLPPECCRTSMEKNNLSFALNQTDLDELMKAENFPENIFPDDTRQRLSIDNETEVPMPDNIIHRLTSPSQNDVNQDEGLSIRTLSKSHRPTQKSVLDTSLQLTSSLLDPTTTHTTNPYAQLVQRLRRAEKVKLENLKPSISVTKMNRTSFDSTIDASTHARIQTLLTFFQSLDTTNDNKLNSDSLSETTLTALFSVDTHLSSSIYLSTNIHQLDIIPKTILHSLKNTSHDEEILTQIQTEISMNKTKQMKSKMLKNDKPFINTTEQQYSKDDSQSSNFTDQDNDLNSKLYTSYGVKTFKEFLIHRHPSVRLPKLFHDIDQWYQEYGIHEIR